jgi:regulator of sigma E protease
MQTIINILVFFLILTVIIVIHELGHFLTAKFFGVYCAEFSIGMGPKIWHKKKGETDYQIRCLPIGGFVAMAGEADQEDNELMKDVPYERTLKGIKTWKKCIIMLAGVFMNFVLAIILLIGVYSFTPMPTNSNTIGTVQENSYAQKAGVKDGDTITAVTFNNKTTKVNSFTDIHNALTQDSLSTKDKTIKITVTIKRNNKSLNKDVTVKYSKTNASYLMGITASTKRLSFGEAISHGISQFWYYATVIFATLGKLITDSANTVKQLSGPVGIYNVTAQVTESGSIGTLLNLTALLSANIGMFNLIPIPGLDGAQVLFALAERIVGREIPIKVKYVLQLVGLALVFGLMIYVTFNDITKLF